MATESSGNEEHVGGGGGAMTTTTTTNNDNDNFQYLALLLASGRLDGLDSARRKKIVTEAMAIIVTNEASRRELAEGLGLRAASECRSAHAYQRICRLLTRALVVHCVEVNAEKSGEKFEGSSETSQGLANALCHLMIRHATDIAAKSGAHSKDTVGGTFHWIRNSDTGRKKEMVKCQIRVCSRELEGLVQRRHRVGESWTTATTAPVLEAVDALLSVARAPPTPRNRGRYAPALACVHHLLSVCPRDLHDVPHVDFVPTRREAVDLLMRRFFGVPNKFATRAEISCVDVLLSSLTQDEFDAEVAPTLGTKLRSSPEAAIGTAAEIIRVVGVGAIAARSEGAHDAESNGTATAAAAGMIGPTSVSGHLESETKLVAAGIRQLRSTKEQMRDFAAMMLVGLVAASPQDAQIVVAAVTESLQGSKSATALSSPDQRLTAYDALDDIAQILEVEVGGAHGADEAISSSVDLALVSLSSSIAKESSDTVKDVGCRALASWLAVAIKSRLTSSKGFSAGVSFLASSVSGAKASSSSATSKAFRARMGSALMNNSICAKNLEEDLVIHLFDDQGKFEQGLKSMIDSAAKKHGGAATVSSAVPQLDAVLAVYLLLLNASHVSKAKGKVASSCIPTCVSKALLSPSSFLYCQSLTEGCTDPIVQFLPRSIAHYCQTIQEEAGAVEELFKRTAGAARALASCAINPRSQVIRAAGQASVARILENSDRNIPRTAVDALLQELFGLVNERSMQMQTEKRLLQATREDREVFHPIQDNPAAGKAVSRLYDEKSVRDCARTIATFIVETMATGDVTEHFRRCARDSLPRALVLTHVGCTSRMGRPQRHALTKRTMQLLAGMVSQIESSSGKDDLHEGELANFIASCACSGDATHCLRGEQDDTAKEGAKIGSGKSDDKVAQEEKSLREIGSSLAVHYAACGLIVSLAQLAGKFDPEFDDPHDEASRPYAFAHSVVATELPSFLSNYISQSSGRLNKLTEDDITLFRSREGEIFRVNAGRLEASQSVDDSNRPTSNAAKKRQTKSRKNKGDFGASFEEEEWERQMKKELAEKKKREEASSGTKQTRRVLTPEEKALLAEQTQRRQEIRSIVEEAYPRSLHTVSTLCNAEIMVGNEGLPSLSSSVISAATTMCPAKRVLLPLEAMSFETLRTLCSCVYEIEETHAPQLARALFIAFSSGGGGSLDSNDTDGLTVCALPSPCPSAAVAISEMDDYGDCLSASSFWFLFPVVRAALTGPRSIPGCEAALRVLNRHVQLIREQNVLVCSLRGDMCLSILELLSHDRSQTFSSPTPYEAIVNLYSSKGEGGQRPISSDISPLLSESGALGGKNCRIASMMALAAIAAEYLDVVKGNPLVENRVWVNCFDGDAGVRGAARTAWRTITSADDDSEDTPLVPPSKIYAVPLLSLLSNDDPSISAAAADAFACAMGMHSDTAERGILRLCMSYVDSFPTVVDEKPAPKKKVAKPTTASKKLVKPGSAKMGKLKTKSKAAKVPANAGKVMTKEQLESQFFDSSKKDDTAKDNPQKVQARLGALRAISSLADPSLEVTLDIASLQLLVGFLMAYANADLNERVRTSARNAVRDIVARHGSSDEAISFLLPHIEGVLGTGKVDQTCLGELPPDKIPKDVNSSDRRKEGAVIALGSVALHLKGDGSTEKIDGIIDMLIDTLRTPSEDVQASVAASLSKLMKKGRTPERVEAILQELMKDCIHGTSLAVRRGSAYGVSAVVKGSGIACLKKYDIVKQLEEACSGGAPNAKEGALFAIELLCDRLGLLFEPYVIVLLPSLLKTFSDSNDYVRAAASNTASLIMSKLSAHGVKLVMPAVLSAFDEPEWRTKQASIHMLGSMSHCAPKQLASCLPKVVPKLTEAFSDTHPKVKGSAEQALNEISKVIRNPEIASLSPVLVSALTDPANETKQALEALIETEFLHAIDAPSLALIVPVLYRGLRDRGAAAKRYSALIAGNMCTMISNPRDFTPYLPILLPSLKAVLLDPIPDCRSTAAKALGSLTRGLGEDALPDLRPWLIDTLRGELGSSVERSGAAQGLTEVLVAGGANVVEIVMIDEILPLSSHPKASTREGVLWVLTFLPSSLGQSFAPLIDESLPVLLNGLSDDSEPVREVAMRAGRVLTRTHGKAHVDKILPSLENGLSDDDWRIRVASLTLLGDLLSIIGGTKVAKGDADTQEDIRQAERAQAQIAIALGSETRKRLLSRLYLARSDTVSVVRSNAVQVWKTVVSVTPRTLREILHVLVEQIVNYLASGNPERTEVAGRCLGEIVTKLGDVVVPELIPVLRDALYRGDEHTRRGACVGLAEVISCSSKDHINKFLGIIVKAVQDALCDEDEGVRRMAAGCFQSLYNVVGSRALDEVVPALLASMQDSEDEDEDTKVRALHGLTGILTIRSRELLPFLVPRLLIRPITINHANALGTISEVTGETIHLHFNSIIPALLGELAIFSGDEVGESEKERELAIRDCARSLFGNVAEAGVNCLVSEIASKCSSDKHTWRVESCWMIGILCEERKEQADFYEQIPVLLRELLYRLNDDNPKVLAATNRSLSSLTKNVPAEELVKNLEFCRNLIASIVSDARRRKGGVGDGEFLLPGLNMPKGLEPLLPIYQRGILYGDASTREVAAAGLGELISLTDKRYLAGPSFIKMTGPLLRIVGDRNPSNVKIAIIQTLGLILQKGGPALRAFVPQFQTTFVKALSDPSRQVRVEATRALALLMPLSMRVDPLIKELVSGSLGNAASASSTDAAGVVAVQTATLDALSTVLRHGGGKAKLPDSVPSALEAGKELLFDDDDGVREGAAKVVGAACELLGVDVATTVARELITDDFGSGVGLTVEVKHGKAHACYRILSSSVGADVPEDLFSSMKEVVKVLMRDDEGIVREGACIAVGAVVGSAKDAHATLKDVEGSILECMDPSQSMEVHTSLARGLRVAVRLKPDAFRGRPGLPVMEGGLRLAMSSNQHVQVAYNNFLWLALAVGQGEEGLDDYLNVANFENSKKMRALATKVLSRIKCVDEED